eukprot:4658267-Amphidinium_carterae.1
MSKRAKACKTQQSESGCIWKWFTHSVSIAMYFASSSSKTSVPARCENPLHGKRITAGDDLCAHTILTKTTT